MRVGHPVALLERLGELEAYHSVNGVRLIGDADLATRDRFTAELSTAFTDASSTGRVFVDLSRLTFLSVGCAADLLRLISQADGYERVDLHCSLFHARVLRKVGAGKIGRLAITTAQERP
jgi:hypothetical protein